MAASVGTLIAAAFETVGYRAQEEVLFKLGEMVHQLGALIFLLAVIFAVLSVGMYGSYSLAKWLIIGPGLFYFLVFNYVNSPGAEWQFGSDNSAEARADGSSNQADLNKMVGGLREVKVARVFDWYNQLVSSLTRSLISVITNQRSAIKQIKFTSRQKLMNGVLGAKLTDPGLIALLEIGLKTQCADAMSDGRTIAYGNRDHRFRSSPEYLGAVSRYKTEFIDNRISVEHDGPIYKYLVDQLRAIKRDGHERELLDKYCETSTGEYNYLYEDFNISPDAASDSTGLYARVVDFFSSFFGDDRTGDFSPELLLARDVNCQRLWCWGAMSLDQEAQEIQRRVTETAIPATASEALKQEIAEEVGLKFEEPGFIGAVRTGSSAIPVVVTGVLFRKAFNDDYQSMLQTNYARHLGVKTSEYNLKAENYREDSVDVAKRQSQHVQAQTLQYEIFELGMSLPYLQGLFLYGLALMYPFFCLLVLIPGRAAGVLNWMALWAWVKSWDVGFAIAMVADDLLWKLMPHRSLIEPTTDSSFAPLTILESAFRPDPAYSLSGYYMIIGMVMVAVPIYCGEMVLGAKKAILGKLLYGFNTVSTRVGRYGAVAAESRMVAPLERYRDESLFKNFQNSLNKEPPPEIKAEQIKAAVVGTTSGVLGRWMGMPMAVASGALAKVAGAVEGAGDYVAENASGPVAWAGKALGFVSGAEAGLLRTASEFGAKTWESGVGLEQASHGYMLDLRFMQAQVEAYKYWRSDEMVMIETLRTTASARGEFWNQPNPPLNAMTNYDSISIAYNNSWIGTAASSLGSAIGVGFDIVGRAKSRISKLTR